MNRVEQNQKREELLMLGRSDLVRAEKGNIVAYIPSRRRGCPRLSPAATHPRRLYRVCSMYLRFPRRRKRIACGAAARTVVAPHTDEYEAGGGQRRFTRGAIVTTRESF